MTSYRTPGTTIINSFPYPIMVQVTSNQQFYQHGLDCYVGGVLIANPSSGGNNFTSCVNASFIVPTGSTYRVDLQTGNTSIQIWAELY
jgi:hypothetical protein